MSKIYVKFAVLLLLVLTSCETYVSTKTLDREVFTFKHAGKNISLPVELQEIRTSRRRGRLFSGRRVTYTYAMAVISNGQELIEYPCDENASIDDFIAKLKIKRSKDRNHFAIGIDSETIAIFHSFNKRHFVGYANLLNSDQSYDFKDLHLNSFPSSREILRDHISGDKYLKTMDETTLVNILCDLSPQDELNQEAVYMLTNDGVSKLSKRNEDRLIAHCKSSETWRKTALAMLKENKEDLDLEAYISKMYQLGGKNEVDKEDWKALKNFDRDRDIDYFRMRMNMMQPAISKEVSKQFKVKLEKSVFNVCEISENQRDNILESVQMLQELGEKRVFERFIESYEKSGCKSETIHDLNDEFVFISNLKAYEKRMWVDFMIRNFKYVPANDRDWDYDRIKEDLTCMQKRDLLLKYKKDIDNFGDMEIPNCN